MFSHADRPTIAPIIRSVFIFGLASALLYSLVLGQAIAAPQTVTRDPQALTLIASSLKALTGGTPVNDVILQASAAYVAGSDEESGTATLTARGNQQSLVQLNLSGGPRQEIRNGPAGAWSGPDGKAHSMATHNCWTDASWFFPVLTLEAAQMDPTLGVAYLGPVEWNGVATLHLQFLRLLPGQTAAVTAEVEKLSALDLYLDPKSLLPLALDFNTHPQDNFNVSIPVEIRFANYENVSGALAPLRIQKYLQGSLLFDLLVTNVSINSGVPQGVFTLPPTTGGAQ
jgi:hypothetical protein